MIDETGGGARSMQADRHASYGMTCALTNTGDERQYDSLDTRVCKMISWHSPRMIRVRSCNSKIVLYFFISRYGTYT